MVLSHVPPTSSTGTLDGANDFVLRICSYESLRVQDFGMTGFGLRICPSEWFRVNDFGMTGFRLWIFPYGWFHVNDSGMTVKDLPVGFALRICPEVKHLPFGLALKSRIYP